MSARVADALVATLKASGVRRGDARAGIDRWRERSGLGRGQGTPALRGSRDRPAPRERRTLAQLSAFDFAVAVAIGAIIGRGAIVSDTSFATSAVALVTFLVAHRVVAILRRRSRVVRLNRPSAPCPPRSRRAPGRGAGPCRAEGHGRVRAAARERRRRSRPRRIPALRATRRRHGDRRRPRTRAAGARRAERCRISASTPGRAGSAVTKSE
jgi:hypothetical protein